MSPLFQCGTSDRVSMLLLLAIVLLLILLTLLVWRLSRLPIRGDIQLQFIWRGAVAGVAGGTIGATLSSLILGAGVYALFGYFFWLLITAILGMVFTFLIGAIQQSRLSINLPGRAAIGAILGIASAWVWASTIHMDHGEPMNWFGNGIISMMICSGVVSGVLSGPLNKEA
jgi:hypothetical protein